MDTAPVLQLPADGSATVTSFASGAARGLVNLGLYAVDQAP